MTTFLSIIGLIALFMFGKFIYDTYLTNNTERDWAVYKKENPEDAEGNYLRTLEESDATVADIKDIIHITAVRLRIPE